jgi:hypothetical protein
MLRRLQRKSRSKISIAIANVRVSSPLLLGVLCVLSYVLSTFYDLNIYDVFSILPGTVCCDCCWGT